MSVSKDQLKQEDLSLKVENHVQKAVLEALASLDGASMISQADMSAICRRAFDETGVSARVKMHASVWADDVYEKAASMIKDKLAKKLQRIARMEDNNR